MVDGEQMPGPATCRDRDRDFARQRVLWEEIEKDLEQTTVGRAINWGADDHDPCIQYRLNSFGDASIFAAAEQAVGRQGGEIDEPVGASALALQRRERQLEQRARARDRLRAAGQAYDGCRHDVLLPKKSDRPRLESR